MPVTLLREPEVVLPVMIQLTVLIISVISIVSIFTVNVYGQGNQKSIKTFLTIVFLFQVYWTVVNHRLNLK